MGGRGKISRSLPNGPYQAARNANSPSASNPFVTQDELAGAGSSFTVPGLIPNPLLTNVQYSPIANGSGFSGQGINQNRLYIAPFKLPEAFTFTKMEVEIVTPAVANVYIGVYKMDQDTVSPLEVHVSSTALDTSLNGVKTYLTGGNIDLEAGVWYGLAILVDAPGVGHRAVSSVNVLGLNSAQGSYHSSYYVDLVGPIAGLPDNPIMTDLHAHNYGPGVFLLR